MDFQRRRNVDARIDMTPMIDTLLQLFVVFMLNMSFLASAIHLELPRAAAASETSAEGIVVSLAAGDRLFVNDAAVSRAQLVQRLRELFAEGRPRRVQLRADRTLPYEAVLDTLVVIQDAGADHVSLLYQAAEGQR